MNLKDRQRLKQNKSRPCGRMKCKYNTASKVSFKTLHKLTPSVDLSKVPKSTK